MVLGYIRAQSRKLERETEQRQELELQVQARTGELAQRNTELLSLNDQLKESSWTDSLTGLKNRRFLDEFIESEVALALRQVRNMDMPEAPLNTVKMAHANTVTMARPPGSHPTRAWANRTMRSAVFASAIK